MAEGYPLNKIQTAFTVSTNAVAFSLFAYIISKGSLKWTVGAAILGGGLSFFVDGVIQSKTLHIK